MQQQQQQDVDSALRTWEMRRSTESLAALREIVLIAGLPRNENAGGSAGKGSAVANGAKVQAGSGKFFPNRRVSSSMRTFGGGTGTTRRMSFGSASSSSSFRNGRTNCKNINGSKYGVGRKANGHGAAAPPPSEHLTLRARVWKALLGVTSVNKSKYMELVDKGEHAAFGSKIRRDTGRTFNNNVEFASRVPEARIIRVLNAFVHDQDAQGYPYVQGLNAICGVLLFEMPELDAFHCFRALVCDRLPSYYGKNIGGCFRGCELVEDCLAILDPELATFLKAEQGADARVYALSPVMTLCACCPPVSEVAHLWDVLFAGGEHLNIVIYATILVLRRDEIKCWEFNGFAQCLAGRDFPEINSKKILSALFPFLLKVGNDVKFMNNLAQHTRLALTSTAATVI